MLIDRYRLKKKIKRVFIIRLVKIVCCLGFFNLGR
jgi:hypothetical protein